MAPPRQLTARPEFVAFRPNYSAIDVTKHKGLFDVVLKRLTIRGSIVGTRKDMQEAWQFAAEGKVKAIIETQPLEEINSVLDRLRRGELQGRVVVKMAERHSARSGSQMSRAGPWTGL